MGYSPLCCWWEAAQQSLKQYKLLPLLLITHQNMMVRLSWWRHYTLHLWLTSWDSQSGTEQGTYSLLTSFRGAKKNSLYVTKGKKSSIVLSSCDFLRTILMTGLERYYGCCNSGTNAMGIIGDFLLDISPTPQERAHSCINLARNLWLEERS